MRCYGAANGFTPDRLGRVTLLGNIVGGYAACLIILVDLARQVFSMSGMLSVIRAIWGHLAVATAITVAAGLAYGAGTIGVPATYGVMLVAASIVVVGYVRWDFRHFPETPAEAERRRRRFARR